ncbi:type II secretion system protein N [Stutzerimonas nitrititolerans]|uniref:type II secretion system protein N n=1 Tax=Stutzerimonas nitrititolerans TaxID=2482751 RepID=UPI0009F19F29|nr:type II secretion system protein N [Stutzerimonas nitrititolerans]
MRRISILPSRLLAGLLLMSGPAAAVEPTQLELLGIFASSDEDRSTALLSVPGQAPLFARIGQPLPGGFSLQAITHDQVLVTRDGRRFRLVLQSRASGAAESPPLSAPAPSAMPSTEPASGAYADACNAIASFDSAQREELQSLGICAR